MRTNADFNHKHYEFNFESLMAAQRVKGNLGIMIKTPPKKTLASLGGLRGKRNFGPVRRSLAFCYSRLILFH